MRQMYQFRSLGPHGQRILGAARALAKPCWTCGKYLLPLLLLVLVAGGIFYVRILLGPISLKMLARADRAQHCGRVARIGRQCRGCPGSAER